jgi:hypothetical protein
MQTMKRARSLVLVFVLVVFGAFAQAPSPANDAAHRRLAEIAGLWTVRQSLWLEPGKPPQVDIGTASFTMVLDGRQLQQDLRVGSSTPFQALGYTGYDSATHSYFATWMDVHLAEAIVLRGDYDAGTRTYRFSGQMATDEGRRIPTREERRMVDDGHFTVRYFESRNGAESLVVQLDYARP